MPCVFSSQSKRSRRSGCRNHRYSEPSQPLLPPHTGEALQPSRSSEIMNRLNRKRTLIWRFIQKLQFYIPLRSLCSRWRWWTRSRIRSATTTMIKTQYWVWSKIELSRRRLAGKTLFLFLLSGLTCVTLTVCYVSTFCCRFPSCPVVGCANSDVRPSDLVPDQLLKRRIQSQKRQHTQT